MVTRFIRYRTTGCPFETLSKRRSLPFFFESQPFQRRPANSISLFSSFGRRRRERKNQVPDRSLFQHFINIDGQRKPLSFFSNSLRPAKSLLLPHPARLYYLPLPLPRRNSGSIEKAQTPEVSPKLVMELSLSLSWMIAMLNSRPLF